MYKNYKAMRDWPLLNKKFWITPFFSASDATTLKELPPLVGTYKNPMEFPDDDNNWTRGQPRASSRLFLLWIWTLGGGSSAGMSVVLYCYILLRLDLKSKISGLFFGLH